MGCLPDDRALQTGFLAAFELFDALLDVRHWNRGDPDQSIAIDAAVLDQPVVINAKTGLLEAGIIEREEIEHQSRIEHFRTEPIGFHFFDAGARIPTAGMLLKTFAYLMRGKKRCRFTKLFRHAFFP